MQKNKVLITGSCGTIGSSLVMYFSKNDDYDEVLCLDNNENQLFFQEQAYLENKKIKFLLADIRDEKRITQCTKGVDTIFHTAALKHVVMCERDPIESIQSNILGVNNIINASVENNVKKVIFTSSDKAVNPTNVMGTSKLMGERLITAANIINSNSETIFTSTRFGNVLGSAGSVIPIFKNQIKKGGPLTLTDNNMTRFVMSIEQATDLVVKSADIAKGGEVIITKMPALKISDLAKVMISELSPLYGHDPQSIEIKHIGSKPGEKLYEELMSEEEVRRSIELKNYFVVLPAFRKMYENVSYSKYDNFLTDKVTNTYNSQTQSLLSQKAIRDFLLDFNLLIEKSKNEYSSRYWPGDKA